MPPVRNRRAANGNAAIAGYAARRRSFNARARTPTAAAARVAEPGSGTGPPPIGPPPVTLTFDPKVVPNENTTLLTFVLELMPVPLRTNVAVWLMNGLCGALAAIEPFAFVYGPGPMIRLAGPAVDGEPGEQTTHSRNPLPNGSSIQPLVIEPALDVLPPL